MRLAEKTIELNYCAQLNERLGRRLVWFGLTQAQEFEAGFDAYARIGGALLVLQFKASNHVLKNKARRFHAQHHQLVALRKLGMQRPGSVFYVFPSIGNTLELSRNSDLLAQTQILDACNVPSALGAPTTKSGSPRKNGIHYVDVRPGIATIHSDPVEVRLTSPRQMLEAPQRVVRAVADAADGSHPADGEEFSGDAGWLREIRRVVSHNALGVIILPLGA